MRLRFRAAALLACAAMARARAGEADPDAEVTKAEAHFRSGYEAFHRKDYPAAVKEFEAASAIHPSPILDYNIGTAYEKIGRRELAVQFLRRYLDESPETPNKQQIEARIAALSKPPEPPKPPPPPPPPKPVEPPPLVCPAGQRVLGIHCCWPGQSWSDEDESCAGTPTCPPGFEVDGVGCRLALRPPPPPPKREPPPPPPVAEPPGPKRIVFTARSTDFHLYHLKVNGKECDTPCAQRLPAGPIPVEVMSPVAFSQVIGIPDRPAIVTVQRRSIASLVAGAIMTPIGTIGLIAGAALIGSGGNSNSTGAVVLIPLSLGALTTGIVLLAVSGSNQLRVLPPGVRARANTVEIGLAAAPRAASAGLTVHF